MSQKIARQYNLPITQTYKLIESFHAGEGNGQICDNCGAYIVNIAMVESNEKKYFIGMDCAETLTGIKNDFNFEYVHKANFNKARQTRAKLQKLFKRLNEAISKGIIDKYNIERIGGSNERGIDITTSPFNVNFRAWIIQPVETWNKYTFPMIKSLIS